MAQLLIRQIDQDDMERLRIRARAKKTSVEALAREALRREAQLTGDEKRELVREMWARYETVRVEGACQTSGVDLIREDRDLDH